MIRQRTIKNFVLAALIAWVVTGCSFKLPRDIFVLRLTKRHPRNPHALFLEGKGYLAQGEAKQAESRFRAALREQPGFIEARLGLAHALRDRGDNFDARDVYREVLQAMPDNTQALIGCAIVENRLGQTAQAEKLFQRALKIDSDSVATLNAVADFYYGRREYGEALRYWERSLRIQPGQPDIRTVVEDLRGYVRKYGPDPFDPSNEKRANENGQ